MLGSYLRERSAGPERAEPALHLAVQGGGESVVDLLLRRRSLHVDSKDEGLSLYQGYQLCPCEHCVAAPEHMCEDKNKRRLWVNSGTNGGRWRKGGSRLIASGVRDQSVRYK